MKAKLAFPQLVLAPVVLAITVLSRHTEGLLVVRGGGPHGPPPSTTCPVGVGDADPYRQPLPAIGEVIGAGAVGVVTGHVIFQSLLISVGFGATAMGVAASSSSGAGIVARSSGRMAVAAFDRTAAFNRRYQVTDRLVEGAKVTGLRLKEFDEEHAVVHHLTQGARRAWFGLKQYDEAHGLSARVGVALASGFDKLAEALTPPRANDEVHGKPVGGGGGGGAGGRGTHNCRAQRRSYDDIRSSFRSRAEASGHSDGGGGGDDVGRGEAGGWIRWREGLLRREAVERGWLGGAGSEGGRWRAWQPAFGGGWWGAKRGRQQQHQKSHHPPAAGWPDTPPSSSSDTFTWRIVWGDDDS